MRTKKIGILLLAVLLASITGCGKKNLLKLEEGQLLEQTAPAIVRIESGSLYGSGIVFKVRKEEAILLTNQHMLHPEGVTVIFRDGSSATAEVLAQSEEKDLGFLRVDFSQLEDFTIKDLQSAKWNEDDFEKMKPGDDLFILGSADYPAGNLFYGTLGNKSIYMEEFGTELLWAYCEVKPGMSGGGVFDCYGNLIGIVCGGNEEKEAAVIPIATILTEWENGRY